MWGELGSLRIQPQSDDDSDVKTVPAFVSKDGTVRSERPLVDEQGRGQKRIAEIMKTSPGVTLVGLSMRSPFLDCASTKLFLIICSNTPTKRGLKSSNKIVKI